MSNRTEQQYSHSAVTPHSSVVSNRCESARTGATATGRWLSRDKLGASRCPSCPAQLGRRAGCGPGGGVRGATASGHHPFGAAPSGVTWVGNDDGTWLGGPEARRDQDSDYLLTRPPLRPHRRWQLCGGPRLRRLLYWKGQCAGLPVRRLRSSPVIRCHGGNGRNLARFLLLPPPHSRRFAEGRP